MSPQRKQVEYHYVEGPIAGTDDYDNPIVEGVTCRIGSSQYCGVPKGRMPCFCEDCYEAPPRGTVVRYKLTESGTIKGVETPGATAAAAPQSSRAAGASERTGASGPQGAPAPDPQTEIRRLRSQVLSAAGHFATAVVPEVSEDDVIEIARRWLGWVLNGDRMAAAPAQPAEPSFAARVSNEAPGAPDDAPATTTGPTAVDVAEWCKEHNVSGPFAWHALGIQSHAVRVTAEIITAWVNGDKQRRSPAGALQLIKHSQEVPA